ncbi:carboxymuconolactone decarboxylase family protein [Nonomuraea sp. NPDC050328]|uniref:carboxymuconolactone decarboxylase family protein n=1 Tax=Nonomuraea sp. NPDC050328 TaxID=3364361 RepID=UPI0037A39066
MSRLSPQPPDTPEARALVDRLTTGPRGTSVLAPDGSLVGPFPAMLLSPPVGDPLQALGAALRYHSSLPDRARELATLAIATHCRSPFEAATHRRLASALGCTAAQLDAVDSGGPVGDEYEDAVLTVTRALLTTGDLDDEQYTLLAEREIFELTTLVGYYSLLALQMRVFRV